MAIINAERLRRAFKQVAAVDCPAPTAGQIAYRNRVGQPPQGRVRALRASLGCRDISACTGGPRYRYRAAVQKLPRNQATPAADRSRSTAVLGRGNTRGNIHSVQYVQIVERRGRYGRSSAIWTDKALERRG